MRAANSFKGRRDVNATFSFRAIFIPLTYHQLSQKLAVEFNKNKENNVFKDALGVC